MTYHSLALNAAPPRSLTLLMHACPSLPSDRVCRKMASFNSAVEKNPIHNQFENVVPAPEETENFWFK